MATAGVGGGSRMPQNSGEITWGGKNKKVSPEQTLSGQDQQTPKWLPYFISALFIPSSPSFDAFLCILFSFL